MAQYFDISNENSILFNNINSSINKNDYNSTSCENLNKFKYKEVQLFNTSDVIKTQFKSNYSIIDVNIVCNGVETNLPVTKKTTNINKEYSLDGIMYDYKGEGSYTGIYYTSGNTYTYGTSTSNGTFNLNGELPEYAVIGNMIEVQSELFLGEFEIVDVVFDEDVDSNVIVVSRNPIISLGKDIIQSQYNLQNYEVYEFEVDFSNYIDLCYIKIQNYSSGYGRAFAYSELIDVQESHDETLEVVYYNDEDGDILYSTGIQNKIRLRFDKIVPADDNEKEYIITDSSANLIDSTIDNKNSFFYREMTTKMLRKAEIAHSSQNVFINDLGYISDGTLTITPIDNTNLSSLEAVMILNGENSYIEQPIASDEAAFAFMQRCVDDGATLENELCIVLDYENNY